MKSMNIQNELGHIVFDLDGTLIDTMSQQAEIFSQVLLKRHFIPKQLTKKFYFSTAGLPLNEQFQKAYKLYGGKGPLKSALLEEAFWKIAKNIKPKKLPEIRNTLKTLKQANYNLFISSGSRMDVVKGRADAIGIIDYIDCMLGSSPNDKSLEKGIGHIKHFAEHLNITVEKFTRDGAIVGDGIHDIEIGREMGLVSIGVTTTVEQKVLFEAGADYVVMSTSDIIDILNPKNGESSQFLKIQSLRKQNK